MVTKEEICLQVPGAGAYALVIRTMLGGVALLKGLDAGTLDDLRDAANECCDCLLHQGRRCANLVVTVREEERQLLVRFGGEWAEVDGPRWNETELSQAVLETLVPQVEMETDDAGRVTAISLRFPRAAAGAR